VPSFAGLAGLVAIAVFVTACGAGRTAGGTTTTHGNGAVAYSSCMRSRGVVSFPDPDSNGTIPKKSLQQLGVGPSAFETAQRACVHLLPGGGRAPDQAEQLAVRAKSLAFSKCVRAHGVPSFPDPASDGRIPDPATAGVDQGSPTFQAANNACARYRPPYMPSNSAYNAYARSQPTGQ
jgi:hypothetical protein